MPTLRRDTSAPIELGSRLDRLVERHGLEKIKTSGDAYLVVSGIPQSRPDHAEALADFALALRDAAKTLPDSRGQPTAIRIGMASGPVAAGVIAWSGLAVFTGSTWAMLAGVFASSLVFWKLARSRTRCLRAAGRLVANAAVEAELAPRVATKETPVKKQTVNAARATPPDKNAAIYLLPRAESSTPPGVFRDPDPSNA